jgi:hypothetical protein
LKVKSCSDIIKSCILEQRIIGTITGGKMTREKRSDLAFGIILILIGGWFLAAKFNLVPSLDKLIDIQGQWPLIVIGVGVFILFLGLIFRTPGMMVPACIVGGIGGLLYWTNATVGWSNWSYLWTMIPGFVGIGILLSTLLGGEGKEGYREGFRLIIISAILFVIFWMIINGFGYFIKYWPILIIILGVWFIIQTIFRKK